MTFSILLNSKNKNLIVKWTFSFAKQMKRINIKNKKFILLYPKKKHKINKYDRLLYKGILICNMIAKGFERLTI